MKKLRWSLGLAVSIPLSLCAQSFDAPSCTVSTQYTVLQEPTGILTLSRALDQALNLNPELSTVRLEVDVSQGAIQQARVRPNPELAALVQDTQKSTQTRSLQINQRLELGGQRSARIDVAEKNREIALADVTATCTVIKIAVQGVFYEAYGAEERYRLTQSALDLAKRVTIVAKKRVLAGKVSPVEETKARLAESMVSIDLAQAEGEWMRSRQRLAAFWGSSSPKFEHVEAKDILPSVIVSLNELLEQLPHSPALVRAQLEIDRRQAIVRLEQSRQTPDITLSLGAQHDETLSRTQAIWGITVPIPVSDRNQGNLQEALRRLDKAREEKNALEIKLKSEVTQAYGHLLTSQNEAKILQQDILPNAQSAYYAATKGFELGKFSFLDVLDAQRTLFQAQTQYIKALSDTYRTMTELNQWIGIDASALRSPTQFKESNHD